MTQISLFFLFLFSFSPQTASHKILISIALELNPKVIWLAKQPQPCEPLTNGLLRRVKLGTMWKCVESGKRGRSSSGKIHLCRAIIDMAVDQGSDSRCGKGRVEGTAREWSGEPFSLDQGLQIEKPVEKAQEAGAQENWWTWHPDS